METDFAAPMSSHGSAPGLQPPTPPTATHHDIGSQAPAPPPTDAHWSPLNPQRPESYGHQPRPPRSPEMPRACHVSTAAGRVIWRATVASRRLRIGSSGRVSLAGEWDTLRELVPRSRSLSRCSPTATTGSPCSSAAWRHHRPWPWGPGFCYWCDAAHCPGLGQWGGYGRDRRWT